MADSDPKCPHCGRPVSAALGSAIADCIQYWRDNGMVTAEQAERLLAAVPSQEIASGRRGVFTPAMALVLVGGILVVTSIVLVVVNVWEHLAPWSRFAVVAVPMSLVYAAGAVVRAARLAAAWLTDGLFLIGGCIAPFAAWLALGIARRLPADGSEDAAGWMALACAVGLVVQLATALLARGPVLTLPPSVSLLWLAVTLPQAITTEPRGERYIPWVLVGASVVLLGVGQAFLTRGLDRHAIAPNVLGSIGLPFAMTVLGAEHQGAWYWASIAVPLAMVLAASTPRLRFLLWPGAVFLVINIFHVGLTYFEDSVGLPLTLLGCGLATLVVGYLVHRVRREAAS